MGATSIGWVSIASERSGGFVYGQRVREALAPELPIELVDLAGRFLRTRGLKAAGLLVGLGTLHLQQHDLWIYDGMLTGLLPLPRRGRRLFLSHHIDSSVFPPISRALLETAERAFYHHLHQADAIVTVSEYWRRHFLDLGYRKVHQISPAFDLASFDFDMDAGDDHLFRAQYGLDSRPIVYIGNCHVAKGVVEAHAALHDLDVQLVTSGPKAVSLPARNLDLTYTDYLRLLKASHVAVTMSRFKEGWCMTAHEAMLVGTPVIGSGLGGMGELLRGGGQVACRPEELRGHVLELLSNPERRSGLAASGQAFARTFTLDRFRAGWRNVLLSLIEV